MSVLRALLHGAPRADDALAWALFDATGKLTAQGSGTPASWPQALHHEAVLDPGCARVVALALPPLAPARLAGAVRFALDDQLAAPADSLHIALGPQARDGSVRVVIIDRALHTALLAFRPRFERVLALPTLRASDGEWHWLANANPRERYLARADGSALAAEEATGSEVAMALRDARGRGVAVARIHAHGEPDAELAALSAATQTPWVADPAWRWTDATTAAFAQATDVLPSTAHEVRDGRAQALRGQLLRPARRLALAAVIVMAIGLMASWIHERIDAWQHDRAMLALASDAGVADADTADSAAAGISQRYRAALHAANQPAADDAWPLLARVAPALAALPHASLRRATYAGGAWTFELGPLETPARDTLARATTAAGVTALTALTSTGMRMRVTP